MMNRQEHILHERYKPYPVSHRPAEGMHASVAGRRWLTWIWILLIVTVFTVGLLALAVAGVLLWQESEEIMPGVQVFGVSVGSLTQTEAEAQLAEHWQRPSMVLEIGPDSLAVSPEALGLVLDTDASLEQAHQVGRSLASLASWLQARGQVHLSPAWSFDATIAESTLRTLAPELNRAPVNARVEIVDGRAVSVDPIPGHILDIPATLAVLATDPARYLAGERLQVIVRPIWPDVTDTSATAAELNRMLQTTIILNAYDPIVDETIVLNIPPESWSAWLTLALTDQLSGDYEWQIDKSALGAYLNDQSPTLGPDRFLEVDEALAAALGVVQQSSAPPTLRMYHRSRLHTVQSGESLSTIGQLYGMPYPWIQQANPELGDTLYAGQTLTIPSPDVLLPLAVVTDKRIIVSLGEQRVRGFEQGQLLWDWPASTGIDESPTSPGIFQIQSHEPTAYASNWDLWMPSFMGVYRPVPSSDFMNGFHGFPNRGGRDLLWTGNLGSKVTYGCILLSSDNAATLYNWAEEGVIVEIRP